MADTQKTTGQGGDTVVPPPPAYHEECPPTVEVAQPPKYVATRVVLPTYAQSELYEKEGVMPTAPSDTTDSSSTDTESSTPVRRWSKQSGTCFEFTIFFIVCAMFSVVGFVFSFCLATSTAAQSGAIAGLGTAFISKPFLYEVYYKGYEQQWGKDWCANYTDTAQLNNCIQWTTTTMRTLFFVLGFFGVVLLYKGFANFFASRNN